MADVAWAATHAERTRSFAHGPRVVVLVMVLALHGLLGALLMAWQSVPESQRVVPVVKIKWVTLTPPVPNATPKLSPSAPPQKAPVLPPPAQSVALPRQSVASAVQAKPMQQVTAPSPKNVGEPVVNSEVVAATPAPVAPSPAAKAAEPIESVRADPPAEPVAPMAPRTVDVSGVSYRRAPVLDYPEVARDRGDQGVVVVHALIGVDGRVEAVSVHQSSGVRVLDQAGLRAVKQAVFNPYRHQGIAEAVYVLIPIEFQLEE